MNKKNKKFMKNMALGTTGAVAGGVAGAAITDLFTDSKALISIGSTLGQYVASFSIFLPLHAHDNQDLYREEGGKFRWKEYTKDMIKLNIGLAALDYLYISGRPFVIYYFQRKGYSPEAASLMSDAVCIPAYWLLSIPLAKGLKITRENKISE